MHCPITVAPKYLKIVLRTTKSTITFLAEYDFDNSYSSLHNISPPFYLIKLLWKERSRLPVDFIRGSVRGSCIEERDQ